MNDTEAHAIYERLMNIQKRYAPYVRNMAYLPALIADINQLNSAHNSNFCNAMTEVLRQWFIGRFPGMESGELRNAYIELWNLHKKYIGVQHDETMWQMITEDTRELSEKYGGCRQLQLYALAIADELERST